MSGNKLILILGKSASGKSTIEKLLEQKGFKRVVSTTTRPRREGEIDGVDYHYISEDVFHQQRRNNEFLESTIYREWLYGVHKSEIDLTKGNYVAVVNPNGYRQIIKKLGKENIVGVYLTINDKERLLRSLHREDNPDCYEICRRFISDIDLFKCMKNEVDLVIENVDKDKTVEIILDYIKRRL